MLPRLLVLLSFMVFEAAIGITNILEISGRYQASYQIPERAIAEIVSWVAGVLIAWLLTVSFFMKKSSRLKAAVIINDAKSQAARITSAATDQALALCSLDKGKCNTCGNPRTGKFCPSCGKQAEAPKDKVDY